MTRSSPVASGRVVASFVLSLALGGLGLYLASPDGLLRAETYRGVSPDPWLLGLFGLALLALWIAPALRIALLCRALAFPLPMRAALAVSLSTSFGSAVTPGKSGGGGVTALALRRLGLPLGHGISVAMHVVVLDLLFYAVTLVPSFLLVAGVDAAGPLALGMALLAATAVGGGVALVRSPRAAAGLLLRLARWRPLGRVRGRIERVARDFYRGARTQGRMPSGLWLLLLLVTAGGWIGNYTLFWALAALYRLDLELLHVLAALNLVTLGANLVPTPGGSGYIEAVVGASQPGPVAAPLLLWRLLSYLPIFLLGPLAMHWLYRSGAPRRRVEG